MYEVNTRRCHRQPMYGTDLIRTVQCVCHYESSSCTDTRKPSMNPLASHWLWVGHAACTAACNDNWDGCPSPLRAALLNHKQRAESLEEITKRWVWVVLWSYPLTATSHPVAGLANTCIIIDKHYTYSSLQKIVPLRIRSTLVVWRLLSHFRTVLLLRKLCRRKRSTEGVTVLYHNSREFKYHTVVGNFPLIKQKGKNLHYYYHSWK